MVKRLSILGAGPRAVALLAALMLSGIPYAGADNGIESLKEAGKAFSSVAEKVSPAVVFISVEKMENVRSREGFPFDDEFFRRFFDQPMPDRFRGESRQRRVRGQGSGFIVSSDGYILTNNHVVGDADEVIVQLQDGREFKARQIGSDERSDVAVIKVDADNLPVLELGDSEQLQVGEWVLAIGSPFGLSHTLTAGIVSAKGRSSVGITDYENFIQTDAAINPGNSGGPLVDLNGQAVGMNTAIFSRSGGYMGIGFAIPINMVRNIMDQLIDTGQVTRGFLGILIQDLTQDLAESFGLDNRNGVLIAGVTDGSPAERGGLKQGDIVVEFDGRDVTEVGSFRNRVSMVTPGTKVKMTVVRDGEQVDLEIEVGTLPDEIGAQSPREDEPLEDLGFSVQTLTPELAKRFEIEDLSGVVVTSVDNGSPAFEAGLRPGMVISEVNRTAVADAAEFNEAATAGEERDSVLLLVNDRRGSRYIALKR
ncbi:MAG: DegQ family serine endoprotease [Proteobacteria bacterium]|nr:MAG: DegQ family serine endoprotease [Pseudomonadota bacterium]